MNNTAWSELPNASHIDRVIASLVAQPSVWCMARDETWDMARDMAKTATWAVAWDAAKSAVENAARDMAWDMAWYMAWSAVRNESWAARAAILAFIAYDDSTKYLEMTSNELKVWIELSQDPAAILLLPYLLVQEQLSTVHI